MNGETTVAVTCPGAWNDELDNRLYRVNKHPTGCQTSFTTGFTTGLTTGGIV